jgi:hypothetical protein
MTIVFPTSASLTLRLVTGSALSYEQMDDNWVALQEVDQEIINIIEGAAYVTESNTFTANQVFAANVGVSGSLSGSMARFGGQVFSSYPGTGFVGTASWAINVVNGGGGGSGSTDVSTYLSSSWTSSAVLTSSFNSWTASYNTGSFRGNLTGTASYASTALSASYAPQPNLSAYLSSSWTGSYNTGSFTGSFTGSLLGFGLTVNYGDTVINSPTNTIVASANISYPGYAIGPTGPVNPIILPGQERILAVEAPSGRLYVTSSVQTAQTASYITNNNLAVLSVYSDQTQIAASSLTEYSMSFNQSLIEDNIFITGSDNTYIKFNVDGIYNIQFSAQVASGGGAGEIYIWLRKNGTDVVDSNTKIHYKNAEPTVASWNFVDTYSSADFVQLMYAANSPGVSLLAEASPALGPSIPSVILSVTQIK